MVADWDQERLSAGQLKELFNMFAVLNTATNHIVAFYCCFEQLGEVKQVMLKHGYTDVEVVFVYSPSRTPKA